MVLRAPVDDVFAAVDQSFIVQADEDLLDRGGEPLVHREPLALPVAGGPELAKLANDRASVLFLPLPDPFEEFFAAEVMARLALLCERLLDDILRRDPRVIGPGHPERFKALHAFPADEDVLNRIVQNMPHGEDAGD